MNQTNYVLGILAGLIGSAAVLLLVVSLPPGAVKSHARSFGVKVVFVLILASAALRLAQLIRL